MKRSSPPGSSPPPDAIPISVFRRLLDATTDPIAIAKPGGELIYLNCWARILAGLSPKKSLGSLNLSHLQPAWAWEIVRMEGIPAALEHGSWCSETAVLRLGHGEVPVQQTLVTVTDGKGEQWIGSIMRDLSQVKRAELEGIAQSSRYETAVSLSGQALFEWSPATGEMIWSGDLHGLLGLDPDDLAGGLAHFRSRIQADDLPAFDHEMARFTSARDSFSIELRLLTGRGEYAGVQATGGYYLDRTGNLGRVTGLLTDRESARRARREIEDLQAELALHRREQGQLAREELKRVTQAKNELLSRMSHELRTPLNAILGFTQLLELEKPNERQAESIAHIARAGQHLLSLVNEVLDLSRLESGRLPITLAPVPIAEIVRETIDLIRPMAARQDVSIHLDSACGDGELQAWADRQRLQQVLLNFLSNAVKYNRQGGRVALGWSAIGADRVRISVEDTGCGISSPLLAKLFQPLDRLPELAPESPGAGISLALSRSIVESMHGELGARSVEGVGSTFWVELGRAPQSVAQKGAPPPVSPPESAAASEAPPVSILLYVEDEDLNLRLVERVLGDFPEFKLISAMQGSVAVDLAREHHPDLVLLDINLPDMSGDVVLARLKEDPNMRDIPVIMVTADVLEHQRDRFLEAGAAAYLTKPFRISELVAVIRETLANRPAKGS